MPTITCVLAGIAFVIAIVSAFKPVPLWIAVLLLSLAFLLGCMPR
jgi:hypothetical protein